MYVNVSKLKFCCQRCKYSGPITKLLTGLGLSVSPTVSEWTDIYRRFSVFTGESYVDKYDATELADYPCKTYPVKEDPDAYMYLCYPKTEKLNDLQCRGLPYSVVDSYQMRVGCEKWKYRVFIPTIHNGIVTFWVARDFGGKHKAKYLNPEHKNRRYHVFNLDRAKQHQDVIITEGVFSAIAAGPNAVCTFGKFVTKEQLMLLRAATFRTYFVAMDGDAVDQSMYVARWLHSQGKQVRVVTMPDGEDPDSDPQFLARVEASKPYSWRTELDFLCNGC